MKTEVILLDSEAYNGLLRELNTKIKELITTILLENKTDDSDWVTTKEAMAILKITTKSTLRKMRTDYQFKYTRSGNGLLYSKKQLLEFLEENAIN